MRFSQTHRVPLGVVVALSFLLSVLHARANEKPFSGVVPAQGPITPQELKIIVIEVRSALRDHDHTVAIQKSVRDAAARAGISGAPTLDQIRTISMAIDALNLFIPVVKQDNSMGYELGMVKYSSNDPREVSAMVAKLPQRTIEYSKDQIRPVVKALVSGLLGKEMPDSGVLPAPKIESTEPFSVLSLMSGKDISKPLVSTTPTPSSEETLPQQSTMPEKTTTEPPSSSPIEKKEEPAALDKEPEESSSPIEKKKEPTTPDEKTEEKSLAGPPESGGDDSELSEGVDAPAEKGNWERWFHRGIYGELGFLMTWCRRELCSGAKSGLGVRLRVGIRIESIVGLSISGIMADHDMPLTTDTEAFLNVKNAFVFGGVFGGVRVHPIRRFFVDPYVGLDVGHIWLLYASNKDVEPAETATVVLSQESIEQLYVRRETVTLKGMAVVPEIGVNIFVVPVLAIGFHLQWLIPIWREACVGVYNPSESGFSSSNSVCAERDKISSAEDMDETLRETLSNKDNLPRFFGLELDLSLLFK